MRAGILFAAWPYAAILIFSVGLLIRSAFAGSRVPDHGLSDIVVSSGRGKVWRMGLTVLLLAHVAGWLFPKQVIQWNALPWRLYVLEGVTFVAALSAVGGFALSVWRHFNRTQGSAAGQIADSVFLSLLFTSVVSGLLSAVFYRWGSSWGATILTPYLRSLLRGQPLTNLPMQMPFLVQLHVFATFTALSVFPFTRLTAILGVALRAQLPYVLTPFRAITTSCALIWEEVLQRLNPKALIWPEEEEE